jgi:hypothetical protein
MTVRISPNPVLSLLDQNGIDSIFNVNSDGSVTVPQVAAPITTPNGVGTLPIVSRTLITSAQLLALKTTPIQLTPTPATGFIIQLENITLRYVFATAAYTLNAGTLKVFQGPVANAKALVADQAALLTAVANGNIIGIPALAGGTAASPLTDAQALAQPLFLGNDGGANYTVGAGTLEVVLTYDIYQI